MYLKGATNFASASRPGEPSRDNIREPYPNDTTEAQGGGRGGDHQVGFGMPVSFNRAKFEVAEPNSDEEQTGKFSGFDKILSENGNDHFEMKEDHSGEHPFMEFATGSRTRE